MLSYRACLWLVIGLLAPLKLYAQTGAFNLEDWQRTNEKLKPIYIKAIMEQAGVHKVTFNLSADFYMAEMNKFAAFATEKNIRPWLKTAVAQNLATIAVIHCDWNNGVPPLEFAQRYLGNEQIDLLKPLYPSAIARLQNNCAESLE